MEKILRVFRYSGYVFWNQKNYSWKTKKRLIFGLTRKVDFVLKKTTGYLRIISGSVWGKNEIVCLLYPFLMIFSKKCILVEITAKKPVTLPILQKKVYSDQKQQVHCIFSPRQYTISFPISERVLISGGTGHIGLHCVLRALKSGYRVRASVRDPDNSLKLEPIRHCWN